jgi:glycosyltransferase involved in cell wall biosynthesis
LDLAVSALGRVRASIPQAELRIYGPSTPFLAEVLRSLESSELRHAVHYLGPQPLEAIAKAIRECDLGIIPNRQSIFTELNTPTRIFEYLSQGKPVIAPRAPGILDYFAAHELIYFQLGNAEDLAEKIRFAFEYPAEANRIARNGQEVYLAHKWSQERMRFLRVAGGLLDVDTQKGIESAFAGIETVQDLDKLRESMPRGMMGEM